VLTRYTGAETRCCFFCFFLSIQLLLLLDMTLDTGPRRPLNPELSTVLVPDPLIVMPSVKGGGGGATGCVEEGGLKKPFRGLVGTRHPHIGAECGLSGCHTVL